MLATIVLLICVVLYKRYFIYRIQRLTCTVLLCESIYLFSTSFRSVDRYFRTNVTHCCDTFWTKISTKPCGSSACVPSKHISPNNVNNAFFPHREQWLNNFNAKLSNVTLLNMNVSPWPVARAIRWCWGKAGAILSQPLAWNSIRVQYTRVNISIVFFFHLLFEHPINFRVLDLRH